MRKFKLNNVIKETDNESKINKYLEMGFVEVGKDGKVLKDDKTDDVEELQAQIKELEEKNKELEESDKSGLEGLELSELKAIADVRGIEYAKNANADTMLELLGE